MHFGPSSGRRRKAPSPSLRATVLEASAANKILGRVEPSQTRARPLASSSLIASRSRLAEGATSPRQAATAAPAPAPAATAAAASPAAASKANAAASAASKASAAASKAAPAASKAAAAASARAASAAVSAAAASNSDLYARLGVSEVVFVEEMERRQADVRDFLLIEEGDLKRRILPEDIGYRSGSRRRERRRRYIRWRSARRRGQRHPGDS